MGLMRNKNLEMEYLNALEDLGLEVDFTSDDKEIEEEKSEKEENNK